MGKAGKYARRPQPTRARKELVQSVLQMADLFQERLKGTDTKVSVSDWIRLLKLHQELAEDYPKDITVTWVDNLDEKQLKDS